MAKSKVDFKQVLLQHGERIGLGVAGAFALLLLVFGLFMPGKGLFSGSPAEKAKVLDETSAWVDNQLRNANNVPGDNDKPDKNSDEKLIAYEMKAVDPNNHRVAHLVSESGTGQLARRLPKVLPIDEALAKFTHMQLQSYILDFEGATPKILCLARPEGSGKGSGQGAGGRLGGLFGGGGMRGGSPGGMGGPPLGGGGGMGMGMGMGMRGGGGGLGGGLLGRPGENQGEESKKDRKYVSVALNELEKRGDIDLAEKAQPLRMVVIGGSFPFKKQVEEFRLKLGLPSAMAVMSEMAAQMPNERQSAGPAFRFLGLNVERRELDGDGNPIGEYKLLDLNATYRPYLILSGRRFEDDDPEVQMVKIPGLVMPRLMQFRAENIRSGQSAGGKGAGMGGPGLGGPGGGGRPGGKPPMGMGEGGEAPGGAGTAKAPDPDKDKYPDVEKALPTIKKTLDELRGKNAPEVALAPERFTGDGFDVFAPPSESNTGQGGEMGAPGGRMGAPGGLMPGGKLGGPPGMGGTNTNQDLDLPEHSLVRLIDVTVQPGKTYQYRIQVRMANPNYGRRDVASPDYAAQKELLSDWSTMPIIAHVDAENHYYVVDQEAWEKDKDPKSRYEGPYRNMLYNRDRMIFLQAHRWLENLRQSGNNTLLFGEWTVAERFPVYKGEFAGKTERVEVPVWRPTREEFVIASDATTGKGRNKGINVYFGFGASQASPDEAIVVDFDQGQHGYPRVVARSEDRAPETKPVTDVCGQEVLIMKPDGRLLLLEGARDWADTEREKRIDKVRKRVKETKNKDQGGGAAPGSPFGG